MTPPDEQKAAILALFQHDPTLALTVADVTERLGGLIRRVTVTKRLFDLVEAGKLASSGHHPMLFSLSTDRIGGEGEIEAIIQRLRDEVRRRDAEIAELKQRLNAVFFAVQMAGE